MELVRLLEVARVSRVTGVWHVAKVNQSVILSFWNVILGKFKALCNQPCIHGICITPDVCTCHPGYFGLKCETDSCSIPHDRCATCALSKFICSLLPTALCSWKLFRTRRLCLQPWLHWSYVWNRLNVSNIYRLGTFIMATFLFSALF